MSDQESLNDEQDHVGSFGFRYKSRVEYAGDVARAALPCLLWYAFSAFSAAWFVMDVTQRATSSHWPSVAVDAVLVASAGIGAFAALRTSRITIPTELDGEGSVAKQAYRRQGLLWEFTVAHELVRRRIQPIARRAQRIRGGSIFTGKPVRMSTAAYLDWIDGRTQGLIRLIDVSKTLMIKDLFQLLALPGTSTERLRRLVDWSDDLTELYRSTLPFEDEAARILPPEGLRETHEIVSGWTDTVRSALEAFCNTLPELEPVSGKVIFNIHWPQPDRLEIALDAIKKARRQLDAETLSA